jgi:two-component system chemotaxis response regulator CheB
MAKPRFSYEVREEPQISIEVGKNFCPEIILIASSTGGPKALEIIFSKLSENFPVPILIVQHITSQFTETLTRRLNFSSALNVKIAEDGESISAGNVYIAPGTVHMTVSKKRIYFDGSPPINGIRPAADILFSSVAENFSGESVLAVILTGMGSDGAAGIKKLKSKKKCFCITQSEKTCVVYGMPRVISEIGLSDRAVDIENISSELEGFDYVS